MTAHMQLLEMLLMDGSEYSAESISTNDKKEILEFINKHIPNPVDVTSEGNKVFIREGIGLDQKTEKTITIDCEKESLANFILDNIN